MEVTIFLAKFFGFVLIAKSIAVFLRANELKKIVNEFFKSPALQIVMGGLATFIGILAVMLHNRWDSTPAILVSLIAWAILLKGLIFLWSPDDAKKFIEDILEPEWMRVTAVVIYILGSYMLGIGFGLV